MLTYPSNYEKALQSPFEENWLFQLHSDDTGNNFIGLSFSDTTVDSVFYYGSVLNRPSIRESVDLQKSVAKTTNLSITIPNFNYNGSDISTQLLNRSGSTHYLNYPVKIYSQLNSATALSDCLQVFNGRLRYVSLSGDKIQLQIVSERPWDNIDIPNSPSDTGVFPPIVYGDFVGNALSDFMTDKKVYPSPRTSLAAGNAYYLSAKSESSSVLNYYDNRGDMFVYLEPDQNATATRDGKDAFVVKNYFNRTYKFRPPAVASGSGFTDPSRSINGNLSNFATITHTDSSSTSLKLELPGASGRFTSAYLYIKADIELTSFSDTTEIKLTESSFGSDTTLITRLGDTHGTGTTSIDLSTSTNIKASIQSNGNQLPEFLELKFTSSSLGSVNATCKIYEVYLVLEVKVDTTNEPDAAAESEQRIDEIYSGNDGLTASWDSSAITKIHEAHRDLIHRFTGWGVSGSTYTTPENWSSGLDISTARTDWPIRYWIDRPWPLRRILEKLQYEGGFISRFRANAELQYVVVPSSPSATDTLGSSDISKLTVSHVAINDIKSKMHIHWNRHPAKSQYQNNVTLTDGGTDTTRTRLNITKSLEGVSEVKLDAYADDSSAQRFYVYYNGIVGDLFIKISGEIVNPLYYKLEVGDQIAIDNNYPYAPFGESWSGKVFMVTSTSRSTHSMKFSARQIN